MTSKKTEMPYIYHLKAFTPNPQRPGASLTFVGTSTSATPLNCGEALDAALQSLADHIKAQTNIHVSRGTFTIGSLELLESPDAIVDVAKSTPFPSVDNR